MAITPFEEFEVCLYAALIAFIGFVISWIGFRGAERLWCSLFKPAWAPSLMMIKFVWVFFYLGIGLCYYLVRRTAVFQDVLISSILFVALVFGLALWPWMLFQFKQLRLSAFWLVLLVILAAATGFFFIVQNNSGVAGVVVICIVFAVLILFLVFLAALNFWMSACPKNYIIISGCAGQPGAMGGGIPGVTPVAGQFQQVPNVVVGGPARSIVTTRQAGLGSSGPVFVGTRVHTSMHGHQIDRL